ncbi:MAG: hypothetical protein VX913_02680 [Planctomycetota bacterium]|nr:hypothetical protein [Planctomycetota bacterium]
MSGLFALIRLDAALLMRRRLPRWIAGTTVFAAVVATLFSGVGDGEGYQAVAAAARLIAATLVGLTSVLGAVAISGDAASGALRAVMVRPVGRPAVVLAHAITCAAFSVALYCVCVSIAWITARYAFGFSDVMYRSSLGVFPIQGLEEEAMNTLQLRLLLLALPALAIPPLIALCISAVTDDAATAVVLALMVTLGPLLFGLITDETIAWLFTERALHPLNSLAELAKGVQLHQDVVSDAAYTWQSVWQPGCWILACVAVSCTLFRSREVLA